MIQETMERGLNAPCLRCGGLLVSERVLDFYGPLPGWKCVNCGWLRRNVQPLQSRDGDCANREVCN